MDRHTRPAEADQEPVVFRAAFDSPQREAAGSEEAGSEVEGVKYCNLR